MRFLLIALMIILLPVRGWMGDVMAMEMAVGSVTAINKGAAHAYSTGSTGQLGINLADSHVQCPDHAGMLMDMGADVNDGANAAPSEDSAALDPCSHCSACQICHSIALMVATPLLAALAQPHQLRPASGLQFASATTAPHLKPPII